jgi:hypothetical protein
MLPGYIIDDATNPFDEILTILLLRMIGLRLKMMLHILKRFSWQ